MKILPETNTPRWVIFLIDILLTVVALGLAYLLRFDFFVIQSDVLSTELEVLFQALPVYLLIKMLAFYLGKIHTGIIRYTGTQDAKRIFLVCSGASACVFVVSMFWSIWFDHFMLPRPIVVVDYLASVFLLISFRIAIKLLYFEKKKSGKNKRSVILYGSGNMGLMTKQALDRDPSRTYQVVGIIDDDPKKVAKRLEGVQIQKVGQLTHLIKVNQVDELIIAVDNIPGYRRRKVADICLENEVKVLTVPVFKDWIDGQLSSDQIKRIKIEDLLGRKPIVLDKTKVSGKLYGRRVLVTGAAGSIGSEIVRQVLQFNPVELVLVDQAESALYDLELELARMESVVPVSFVIGDIRNKPRVRHIFRQYRPEVVFHAAAYKHVPLMENNAVEAVATNILGTQNLVDISIEHESDSFVMISTDKAVNPTNVMGASKRIAEIYVQAVTKNSSTQFITTRFGNVLGSNGSVIPLFRKQIENGGPITVTHQEVTRYFMTIPEACQLVLEAFAMGAGGEIYVFDMGDSVKILDLAKKMVKLSGLEIGRDINIEFVGLRPGEKLYEELLNDGENQLATHHEQIMIGKVRQHDADAVKSDFQLIAELVENQQEHELVQKMKEMVPEFKSNNSVFAKFDD